jgi:hypothetical protein
VWTIRKIMGVYGKNTSNKEMKGKTFAKKKAKNKIP